VSYVIGRFFNGHPNTVYATPYHTLEEAQYKLSQITPLGDVRIYELVEPTLPAREQDLEDEDTTLPEEH
jgi:hypothetical protein